MSNSRILPQMSDSPSLLWSPVLMMRQSDPHCLDWRCRSYWCRSFPDCGFAAVFLDRAAANPSPSASMGVMGGYSGPAVNGGGHNASWRVDRRMGSLGFHRCQRNACYDRRCDCIPVPCSSEDMDFSSDRDRGGNDGDRRLRGSVALTGHLTEVMRPAMSSLPPFKTIGLLTEFHKGHSLWARARKIADATAHRYKIREFNPAPAWCPPE